MKEKNYLDLMQLHCEKIRRKMRGKTHRSWVRDENLRDAVCMRLMALAECVKNHLKEHPDILDEYPHIPWDNIIRFRDKVAHHYEGVDHAVVWKILESNMPAFFDVLNDLVVRDASNSSSSPNSAMRL